MIDDLADKAEKIIEIVEWRNNDRGLLSFFRQSLQDGKYNSEANTVQRSIAKIEREKYLGWGIIALCSHVAFWLVLIFAYPRFPQIQATFFWTRWVRVFVGIGYVGFLLTWIPFLRRRLFAPFTESLVVSSKIIDPIGGAYFEGATVATSDGSLRPIKEAIPRIQSQIILEGESGSGKSLFVHHLVSSYSRLVVVLHATECDEGVLLAIQRKLEGPARDPIYLRSLIYARALDVVIDGLNETSSDTRAIIFKFAERFYKGNLLLVTQPMVPKWPPNFEVYVMQRLTDTQMYEFLGNRRDSETVGTQESERCVAEYLPRVFS